MVIPAPGLFQPDPERRFIVEVDTSDSEVGAVLSQGSEQEGKLLPCAYFSRCLSPADQNYDLGNRAFSHQVGSG